MRDHHGARVVLCEYLDYGLKWVDAARSCGLSFFVHAHGYDVSLKLKEAGMAERYRLAYSDVSGVIVVSRAQRECLVELGIPRERIALIPCGADPLLEQPVRSDHRPVRCMAVGRMVGKKAPILLLDAFRRAFEKGSNITLDYYGGGALLPAAEQYIHAFKLEHVVKLHGVKPHNEICEAMKTADIFLQHSWTDPGTGDQEGMPVAILEAMAHGLPVIATRHAGIPDAVVNGETGYIVEEGAVEEMADCLYDVACDYACRDRFGKASVVRQNSFFSWEKEKQLLCDLLGLLHGGLKK
jgi:glycosyltransferase involved in cell wall biosynthesis